MRLGNAKNQQAVFWRCARLSLYLSNAEAGRASCRVSARPLSCSMKRFVILLAAVAALHGAVSAQEATLPSPDAKAIGMGGVMMTTLSSSHAIYNNPALVAFSMTPSQISSSYYGQGQFIPRKFRFRLASQQEMDHQHRAERISSVQRQVEQSPRECQLGTGFSCGPWQGRRIFCRPEI